MSKWREWKESLGETRPWDFMDPNVNRASEETVSLRLDVCGNCEEFALTRQCKKCGCFMDIKAKLEKAACPLGKW
jgi:hypothetical protein